MMEAGRKAAGLIEFVTSSGQTDENGIAVLFAGTQHLDRCTAIRTRHVEIEERQVRPKQLGHAYASGAIERNSGLATENLQEHAKRRSSVDVVIDDQHAKLFERRFIASQTKNSVHLMRRQNACLGDRHGQLLRRSVRLRGCNGGGTAS